MNWKFSKLHYKFEMNCLKFCNFLLYLPPWTKNWILVRKFSIPDITLKLEILYRKLSSTASARLSPHHHLISFFRWFCVCIGFFLCVFLYLFLLHHIYFICHVGEKINKLITPQLHNKFFPRGHSAPKIHGLSYIHKNNALRPIVSTIHSQVSKLGEWTAFRPILGTQRPY